MAISKYQVTIHSLVFPLVLTCFPHDPRGKLRLDCVL